MKKIIIFLGLFALTINSGLCGDCDYTCSEPYGLSHGASRFMSAVTGSNFVAEQVAEVILKKEVLKTAQGNIKTHIDSYSVKDLKKGIFKSMSIKGKNVNMDGVYFTSFDMHTLCNFNYISQEDPKNPVFMEPLPLAFSVVMSEEDLNKTMQNDSYKRIITDVNRLGTGFFTVQSSFIKIKNDKFYYILKVAIPFVKNVQSIVLTSDLKVVKGKVDFTNTKLVNNSFSVDLKKMDKLINYINPLDFSLNILENRNANLKVQEVKIKENKIYADGLVVIR